MSAGVPAAPRATTGPILDLGAPRTTNKLIWCVRVGFYPSPDAGDTRRYGRVPGSAFRCVFSVWPQADGDAPLGARLARIIPLAESSTTPAPNHASAAEPPSAMLCCRLHS